MNYTCWFKHTDTNIRRVDETFFIPVELDRDWDIGNIIGLSGRDIVKWINDTNNVIPDDPIYDNVRLYRSKLLVLAQKHPESYLYSDQFPTTLTTKKLQKTFQEHSWKGLPNKLPLLTCHPNVGFVDLSSKDHVLAVYRSLLAENHPDAARFLRIANIL